MCSAHLEIRIEERVQVFQDFGSHDLPKKGFAGHAAPLSFAEFLLCDTCEQLAVLITPRLIG